MVRSRNITLEQLGEKLTVAKARLSVEKKDILQRLPLAPGFNREEYVFAYLRAEREGMHAIQSRLTELAWLPMQLDPHSELVSEQRSPMKLWLKGQTPTHPSAEDFGNDFIHVLTRSALHYGLADAAYGALITRIADLFRDLSCLIGMIYYATWLAERDVEGIILSNPEDLHQSVIEIAAIVQSPDLHRALKQRAEVIRKAKVQKALEKASDKTAPKARPFLHVIHNSAKDPAFTTADPLPV